MGSEGEWSKGVFGESAGESLWNEAPSEQTGRP